MVNELQLFRRSVNRHTLNFKLIVYYIDFKIVVYNNLFGIVLRLSAAVSSSENGFDSRHNLFCVKRLCNIVISAELKTQHLVKGLTFSRKHYYGSAGSFPDFTAYLPAVHFRQHDVKQNKVGRF